MSARAMWKGRLQLGATEVPVKMYSAVRDQKVHFRLLHAADRVPVEQAIVRKSDGQEVPSDERYQALPLAGDTAVILRPEELAELEPEPSRGIELCRFVPPSAIGDRWYDRPYFLGPDGDDESYFALVDALEKRELVGVARWVMRKKRYLGALRAIDGYLMMVTLRRADQVVAVTGVKVPKSRQPDAKELKMAEQLVSMLEGDFEPERWHDEYRERVVAMVEAKSRGEAFAIEVPERERPEGDLAAALEQSLSRAGGKKVA